MLLMEEAERIAKEEHGSFKISVISGNYICSYLHVYRNLTCCANTLGTYCIPIWSCDKVTSEHVAV